MLRFIFQNLFFDQNLWPSWILGPLMMSRHFLTNLIVFFTPQEPIFRGKFCLSAKIRIWVTEIPIFDFSAFFFLFFFFVVILKKVIWPCSPKICCWQHDVTCMSLRSHLHIGQPSDFPQTGSYCRRRFPDKESNCTPQCLPTCSRSTQGNCADPWGIHDSDISTL